MATKQRQISTSADDGAGGFSSLGLTEALVQTLTKLGYEEPTPIQREAIPLLIGRRDRRRHARPRAGSSPPQDAEPREAADARARRGGRNARHGLRGRSRSHSAGHAVDAANRALLRDDASPHCRDRVPSLEGGGAR